MQVSHIAVALLALALLGLVTLGGCSIFESKSSGHQIMICPGDEAEGSVELKVGATLIVCLDANPSTGFTWEWIPEIDEASSILRELGEPEFEADANIPGSGGTLSFSFDVLRAGAETMTFIYHRPFETDVEPAETYTLQVTARN